MHDLGGPPVSASWLVAIAVLCGVKRFPFSDEWLA
jgi:hypothetical protein